MNAIEDADAAVSRIAAAIGEPARSRMLFLLMDGHARTSTELAVVAEVTPSTASAHLNRLKVENLVKMLVQGKHRYYSLDGPDVASVLEGLSGLAGHSRGTFVPTAPCRLQAARRCYDHMAGAVSVMFRDHFREEGWLVGETNAASDYDVSREGKRVFERLGIDIEGARAMRRRFAYDCLDWSERRAHLGGQLGAAFLKVALGKRWMIRELDSRALQVTSLGRRDIRTRFGLSV
jgi:DNA-binding transcriptional ArsR family regulator